jgi:hypothetical protein
MKQSPPIQLTQLLELNFLPNLQRIAEDLYNVKNCSIGRPARYYYAYQSYTTLYNIELLESFLVDCNSKERCTMEKLLSQYMVCKDQLTKEK